MHTSWYLNFHINDIKTLFSEQILPYEVDCFICTCGKKHVIIKYALDTKLEYICEECGNEEFLDAGIYFNNMVWYNKIQQLFTPEVFSSLPIEIEFNENKKILNCNMYLSIPKYFDVVSNEVIYGKKSLFKIDANDLGTLKYEVNANFDLKALIKDDERYYNEVSDEILINRCEYLIDLKNRFLKKLKNTCNAKTLKKSSTLEEFTFFLKNNHLINSNFYLWNNTNLLPKDKPLTILDALNFVINNRKEKSLRRFVLTNYKEQIQEKKSYNFIYIYSLSRCIKDINLLRSIMDINIENDLTCLDNPLIFIEFLEFLISRFSIKQIQNSLKQCHKDKNYFLADTIELYSQLTDYLDYIQLNSCDIIDLHNDFSDYHRYLTEKVNFKKVFQYDIKYLNPCIKNDEYQIKLPRDGEELYQWSYLLQNCLSGYILNLENKKTIVYGFFIDNQLKFAVEIKNGIIIQAKGKCNRDLNPKEQNILSSWFKKYFEEEKA